MIKPVSAETPWLFVCRRCFAPPVNSNTLRRISTNSAIARGIRQSGRGPSPRLRPSSAARSDSDVQERFSKPRSPAPPTREPSLARRSYDEADTLDLQSQRRDQVSRDGRSDRPLANSRRRGQGIERDTVFERSAAFREEKRKPAQTKSFGWGDEEGGGENKAWQELLQNSERKKKNTELERGRGSVRSARARGESRVPRPPFGSSETTRNRNIPSEADRIEATPPSPRQVGRSAARRLPEAVAYTTAASEFIIGARVSTAALRAGRRKFYKLYIDARKVAQEGSMAYTVYNSAKKAGVEVIELAEAELYRLDQISKGRPHDGVVLESSPASKLPVKSLGSIDKDGKSFSVDAAAQSLEDREVNGEDGNVAWHDSQWRMPFVLWLDGVVDVQNVGALLRSAFYFSVDAVILTSRATAGLNLGVLRSSAGASEHIQILTVDDPESFIKASHDQGWRFHAAVARDLKFGSAKPRAKPKPLRDLSQDDNPVKRSPCVLILGNEDEGLPRWIQRQADGRWTISGSKNARDWDVDSLNVSVAGGIFLERFLKKPPNASLDED